MSVSDDVIETEGSAFTIIPQFDTGLITVNLATISGSGASTGGETGIWFLGPAELGFAQSVGVGGWPYSLPIDLSSNAIPWQVHMPAFPVDIPDTDFGLSGSITIPYVSTSPSLKPDGSIHACGDSTYFNLNLEIFKLLGKVLENIPIADAAAPFFSNLSGSYAIGAMGLEAVFKWNFFSASFDANITNHQCFDFKPKIYGKYEFPVPVEYSITDTNGMTSPVQQSSIVNVELGDDINYKFPCDFRSMDITPTYSIDGVFRNHTYDSVSFDFLMSAFEFSFEIPAVIIIPSIHWPEVCMPYGYPCGSVFWPSWCTGETCTPSWDSPEVGFSGFYYHKGPLWSDSEPLGSFSYDWYDNTWSLEGFKDTTFAPFRMIANQLSIDAIANNTDCYGGANGSVDITVGAVSDAIPYSYVWTNGFSSSGGNTTTLNNLSEGSYQVSVTDAHGCQLFNGGIVKEPSKIMISYVKHNKSCGLGSNDGSIDVTVSGGTGTYTYLWSNGSTSQDLLGLDTGIYSLTVTDSKGCQNSISINIDQPDALTHSAIVDNVDCNGDNTGSIDVSVVGGTLPYSYSWSSGQSTKDIANLSTGSYNFTVTDMNNCQSANTYVVNEPSQPLVLNETSNDVSCYGDADGTIDVSVTGGSPSYSYQWYGNNSGLMSFNGEDPTGLKADLYSLVVSDLKGCNDSLNVNIAEPSAPITSTEIITNVNCFGDATGVINPQISGGTPLYGYAWSNASNGPIISNVVAGTYTLDVTDNKGCHSIFNYSIEEPLKPLTIALQKLDVLCYGDNTGAINAGVSGGTKPYIYNWSNGSSTQNLDSLNAGNYSLTVTDALGCTSIESISILEPSAPLALSSIVQDVLCFGDSTGSIDLSISGGTGIYSYEWSNGNTYIYAATTQDLSNLSADHYFVTVTDQNQCSDTLLSIVNGSTARLSISYAVTNVDCYGSSTGAIDISVSGGTTGYTFAWSNGANSEDLALINAGIYSVTVTDQNGCQMQTDITVSQPKSALTVSTSGRDVRCFGDSTGSIVTNVIGGTASYTYMWSNASNDKDIDGLLAGIYTVTVTDANGCTAFSGATINEPSELNVNVNITDPSCYGYKDGHVNLTVTGGIQPYYFNWGNQNQILLNNPSETIDSIPTGDYFIRVKDENGCKFEQLINVGEPNPFTFQSIIKDATCFGGTDGAIDLTLNGGTSPYTINWSNGVSGEDIQNVLSNDYSFVATDDQGCVIRSGLHVGQPDEIGVASDMVPVSCIDQSDAAIHISPFGGTTPYSYSWSNNISQKDLENIKSGIYTLIITDNANCSNNFEFIIDPSLEECLGIPNTFTPNGDSYNDTWVIRNLSLYPNSTVKVFNKWGNEIFSSKGDYKPWEGTYNSKELPSGVYYYIIILSNKQDNKYTGTITIVR